MNVLVLLVLQAIFTAIILRLLPIVWQWKVTFLMILVVCLPFILIAFTSALEYTDNSENSEQIIDDYNRSIKKQLENDLGGIVLGDIAGMIAGAILVYLDKIALWFRGIFKSFLR